MNRLKGNAIDYVLDNVDCVLLHVCNNKGVMGSGIAKEIKERIPTAYENYREGYISWGECLGYTTSDDNLCVYNMVCQDGYGAGRKHIRYGMLAKCLVAIKEEQTTKVEYVIPYLMGSYRAGGDWKVVYEICCDILGEENIVVVEI